MMKNEEEACRQKDVKIAKAFISGLFNKLGLETRAFLYITGTLTTRKWLRLEAETLP
jgi:hypothetical protein